MTEEPTKAVSALRQYQIKKTNEAIAVIAVQMLKESNGQWGQSMAKRGSSLDLCRTSRPDSLAR